MDAQRREVALDEQLRERLRALDRLDEDDDLGGKEREKGTKQRGVGEYRHIHMLPLYMSQKNGAVQLRKEATPYPAGNGVHLIPIPPNPPPSI